MHVFKTTNLLSAYLFILYLALQLLMHVFTTTNPLSAYFFILYLAILNGMFNHVLENMYRHLRLAAITEYFLAI